MAYFPPAPTSPRPREPGPQRAPLQGQGRQGIQSGVRALEAVAGRRVGPLGVRRKRSHKGGWIHWIALPGVEPPSGARAARRGRGSTPSAKATNATPGGGKQARGQPRGKDPGYPPAATEETGVSCLRNLSKQHQSPTGDRKRWEFKVAKMSQRHAKQNIRDDLVGIETNPGPFWTSRGNRGRGVHSRQKRRER